MTSQFHRRSIRLQDYDYSQNGAYFITICTNNQIPLFGHVVSGEMILNQIGQIVQTEWIRTGMLREGIFLDEFVIMPNHLHGILIIEKEDLRMDTLQNSPNKTEKFGKPVSNSIPSILRGFKSTTSRQVNLMNGTNNIPVWQRNYYEHVIRSENDLDAIRIYIEGNTLNWQKDQLFVEY